MRGKRELKKRTPKKLLAILLIFFAGELLIGGAHVGALLKEYAAGEAAYRQLSRQVRPARTTEPAQSEEAEASLPEETPPPWPEVDFEALAEINPDVVGWISIEGTGIDYPIVQGEDNKYYLKHLFTGEENRAGCVFLDCGNAADFSDPNSVVYGHYLNDGSMFSPLLKYKRQEYFDAHPTGWLVTKEKAYKVCFFAGAVSDVWGAAWDIAPSGTWAEEMIERSRFSCGVVPKVDDRFLTLSTCSYEFSNARFVLVGVLEEQG